ncbi:MAG: hypothetical protein ABEI52_01400, partial [Halobacteriaceae archaeon]
MRVNSVVGGDVCLVCDRRYYTCDTRHIRCVTMLDGYARISRVRFRGSLLYCAVSPVTWVWH